MCAGREISETMALQNPKGALLSSSGIPLTRLHFNWKLHECDESTRPSQLLTSITRFVCLPPGSSEQHGGSSNMNVNVISPEKVSASVRRRYETQVRDAGDLLISDQMARLLRRADGRPSGTPAAGSYLGRHLV